MITYLLLNSDYGIGCVYSPFGLVIFVAVERTFVCFTKSHEHYFKFYSLRLLWRTVPCDRGGELCRVISAVRVCRLPSLLAMLLLDTLCSKKWYDMTHIGCGIHWRQWSTIPRIGRHSAVYNSSACALFFIN